MAGNGSSSAKQPEDFSLVLGGPLYQMYLGTRLATPPLNLLERRIVAVTVVTWLPLAVLTAIAGDATSSLKVPFLADLEVHARFLLALPLLIGAENLVHQRMQRSMRQFLESGIIAPDERVRVDQIGASLLRLRNSATLEVLLLVASLTLGYWFWRDNLSLHVNTWYARIDASGGLQLTLAGYWYAFVSLALFRFILLRWYLRIVIWWVFLWRIARLSLRLNPLHPDRAGGLGGLGSIGVAFFPLVLAHTAFLAGVFANLILYEGVKLPALATEILGSVVVLTIIVVLPLMFFVRPLLRAKYDGRLAYGALATRYVDEFRAKWLQPGADDPGPLVGSADIQSLADLGGSYDVVRAMRIVPFSVKTVIDLASVAALPFLPLILTMIPLDQLVSGVFKKFI